MRTILKNAAETKKLAGVIAKKMLRAKHFKHAAVLGLVGELGAGKTTFIQGFAKELGIKRRITSPTFLIFRKYKIPASRFMIHDSRFLYHVDCYRIQKPKELFTLGFKKILADPKNIVLIEWADRIKKTLPKDTIWISFKYGKKITERIVS
jgi:tRNA threonylcarbamoyladenosine biosynthesis protein TsaE